MTAVSRRHVIGKWGLFSTGKIAYATKIGLLPIFSENCEATT
jgi:hypothetical protein